MDEWPTGWKHSALRALGVPVTQHALDVLGAWEESTPTQPWTHNPLGLRHGSAGTVPVFDTQYGAFPSHVEFRAELKRIAHGKYGKPLIHVLMNEGDLAGAWRVINALGLPSNDTETDYPSALLDMVEDKYRSNLGGKSDAPRRTSGKGRAVMNPHAPVNRAAITTRQATADIIGLRNALSNMMKGLN